jgi:hypothetical protein
LEAVFRDTKHWMDAAMAGHVDLALLTSVVLQTLRVEPEESVAAVKERWRLEPLRNEACLPPPLHACLAYLCATA